MNPKKIDLQWLGRSVIFTNEIKVLIRKELEKEDTPIFENIRQNLHCGD